MHLPIPCSSPVEIPSFLGFPTKYSYLSSTCSLFLLSFIGLTVVAAVVTFKFFLHRKSRTKLSTNIAQKSEKELMQAQRRTWSSLLAAWDGVTWPVSLTAPPSTAVGRGVGLNGAVLGEQTSQLTRNAPSLNQTRTWLSPINSNVVIINVLQSADNLPVERTNINGENDHVSPCECLILPSYIPSEPHAFGYMFTRHSAGPLVLSRIHLRLVCVVRPLHCHQCIARNHNQWFDSRFTLIFMSQVLAVLHSRTRHMIRKEIYKTYCIPSYATIATYNIY